MLHEKTAHGWCLLPGGTDYDVKVNHAEEKKNTKLPTPVKPASEKEFSEFIDRLEKNRRKLEKVLVSRAQPQAIKGRGSSELRKNTAEWISNNIKEPVQTEIGNITFKPNSADDMYYHGTNEKFRLKADVVPCIKDILEKGVYIGMAPDFDGKDIDNYYFAGKVKTKNGKELVFCRVRDSAGDNDSPRFYLFS